MNVMHLVRVVMELVEARFPSMILSSREYRRRLFRSGTLRVEVTDKGFGCDRQRIWLEEYDEDVVRNRVGHCLVPLCQLEQLPCTPTDEGAYTLDSSVEANVIRSLDVSMLL